MGPDMMPNLATLTGKGIFDVVKAAINQSEVMTKIASLTTLPELKTLLVVDKKIQANIVDGNLVVQPFDLTIGDVKMTLGGSNSLAGALAYVTALNVPTGKLGSALNSKLTQLTGVSNIQGTERVTLGLNIGGTVTSPSVKLTSGSVKDQGKALVTNVAKQKALDLLGLNKPRSREQGRQLPPRRPDGRGKAAAQAAKTSSSSASTRPTKPEMAKGLNSLFNKPKPKPKPVEPADTTKK